MYHSRQYLPDQKVKRILHKTFSYFQKELYYRSEDFVHTIEGQKELYIMTFLQFQKELYYISEGIILKNSQKDLRRCEGFQKDLYSALLTTSFFE